MSTTSNTLPPPPSSWHAITPEQWHAEAALWEIPESDRPAAAAYEINREQIRIRWESEALAAGRALKCYMPEPWLCLDPFWRAYHRHNLESQALDPFPAAAMIDLLDRRHESPGAAQMVIPGTEQAENTPSNAVLAVPIVEAFRAEQSYHDGVVCAFRVNPKAGRRELLDAFARWLDGNEIGTDRTLSGAPKELVWLRTLALYRLRKASVHAEFWEPLTGTCFQWWDDGESPPAIRAAMNESRWLSRTLENLLKPEPSWPYEYPKVAPTSFKVSGEIVLKMPHDGPMFQHEVKS